MKKKKRIKNTEKKANKKRIVSVVFWGCLFILLGFLGNRAYSLWDSSIWDGKSKINIIIQADPVMLVSFSPENGSLGVLMINKETFIEAVYGYGFYRVESIYRLGELNGWGGELLAGSIQEYLGVPVDAYAFFSNYRLDNQKPAGLKNFLEKVFLDLLMGKGNTDLSRWDLIRLFWASKKVRVDKVSAINLEETSASFEIILPDGTKALKIDNQRLDNIVKQLFTDETIRGENMTVAILNGTHYQGLARRAARIINNIGGRVVRTGEEEMALDKCEVRSSKEDKASYTVEKVMKIFGCRWSGESLKGHRAEVVLFLGEDYQRKLTVPPDEAAVPIY